MQLSDPTPTPPPHHHPPDIAAMLATQNALIAERQRKSVALAVLLALIFGPLGLLYSAPVAGLILIGIFVVFGWFALPLVILGWFFCPLWAWIKAADHNAHIDKVITAGRLR